MREALQRSLLKNEERRRRVELQRSQPASLRGAIAGFSGLISGEGSIPQLEEERLQLEGQLQREEGRQAQSLAAEIEAAGGGAVDPSSLPLRDLQSIRTKQLTPAAGVSAPSAVREFEFVQTLSPEDQRSFLNLKRSDPLRAKGLVETATGGVEVREGFAAGVGAVEEAKEAGKLTAKAKLSPSIKKAEEIAKAVGKEEGIAITELDSQLASFPNLQVLVGELSELGKVATFTKAGQLADVTRRELGLPVGAGAVARSEYIAKIDNEILPLLRQTFGAQFTENEGNSLKATLGDVNKSPEEKDAILKSFIVSKFNDIKTKQRRTGQEGGTPEFDPADPLGQSVDALPEGATQIGTSGGKPVFRTPDGKTFIQD